MNRMTPITISAGCDHGGRPADRVREGLAHHAAAGGDEHQEERAEQLRREASELQPRVLEVGHRINDLDLEPPFEPPSRHCMRILCHRQPRPSERSCATRGFTVTKRSTPAAASVDRESGESKGFALRCGPAQLRSVELALVLARAVPKVATLIVSERVPWRHGAAREEHGDDDHNDRRNGMVSQSIPRRLVNCLKTSGCWRPRLLTLPLTQPEGFTSARGGRSMAACPVASSHVHCPPPHWVRSC